MFRFSPIFNDFFMDYLWLSLINLWLISRLIIGGLALDLRYLDRCTPQSPDPIGDHNRPFAIGSTFSLKTNTFSFKKKLLASELWKQFMLPYFALILPYIWQICRYSTLTTGILRIIRDNLLSENADRRCEKLLQKLVSMINQQENRWKSLAKRNMHASEVYETIFLHD